MRVLGVGSLKDLQCSFVIIGFPNLGYCIEVNGEDVYGFHGYFGIVESVEHMIGTRAAIHGGSFFGSDFTAIFNTVGEVGDDIGIVIEIFFSSLF